MTTAAAALAKQRTALRDVDLALMGIAFDVASDDAALHVGRARANVRAALQALAAAARQKVDATTAGYDAIAADVAVQAKTARLVGDLAREALGS